MKSSNFKRLNGEICRKLQNFSNIYGIETNFGQNKCPKMWKFTLPERHFNELLYIFLFHKKNLVRFLSYVILKFTVKIVRCKINYCAQKWFRIIKEYGVP